MGGEGAGGTGKIGRDVGDFVVSYLKFIGTFHCVFVVVTTCTIPHRAGREGQREVGRLSLNLCYFSVPARDKDCKIMSNVLCAMACIALLIYWACLCILFQHALLPLSLCLSSSSSPSLPLPLCLHKLLLLTQLSFILHLHV